MTSADGVAVSEPHLSTGDATGPTDDRDLLEALQSGALHRFSDWPNSEIPQVAAGVYTIWDGDKLVYVGMAGRSLTAETISGYRSETGRRTGLASRLNSHASGRRSGDQFCVYVCDRLVLPTLTESQISEIADGRLSLDSLVRAYIHERLAYRVVETADAVTARLIEHQARRGVLAAGKPHLNPLARTVTDAGD